MNILFVYADCAKRCKKTALTIYLPLGKIAGRIGISLNTAHRLNERFIADRPRERIEWRNRSNGRANPERGLIRRMLSFRAESGEPLYSFRFLSTLFECDIGAIQSANSYYPAIRAPEEVSRRNTISQRGQFPGFMNEAKARLSRLRAYRPLTKSDKDIFALNNPEKNMLEEILFREIDGIPSSSKATTQELEMVKSRLPMLKRIVRTLMHTNGFWLENRELAAKCGIGEGGYKALGLISNTQGTGLIVQIGKIVAINPEVVFFLQQGDIRKAR